MQQKVSWWRWWWWCVCSHAQAHGQATNRAAAGHHHGRYGVRSQGKVSFTSRDNPSPPITSHNLPPGPPRREEKERHSAPPDEPIGSSEQDRTRVIVIRSLLCCYSKLSHSVSKVRNICTLELLSRVGRQMSGLSFFILRQALHTNHFCFCIYDCSQIPSQESKYPGLQKRNIIDFVGTWKATIRFSFVLHFSPPLPPSFSEER